MGKEHRESPEHQTCIKAGAIRGRDEKQPGANDGGLTDAPCLWCGAVAPEVHLPACRREGDGWNWEDREERETRALEGPCCEACGIPCTRPLCPVCSLESKRGEWIGYVACGEDFSHPSQRVQKWLHVLALAAARSRLLGRGEIHAIYRGSAGGFVMELAATISQGEVAYAVPL